MSNPWSQAYEDLRKPYLEGKMAKKDYDGDGKIESGTDEYMGSRDKAIKKAMGKKIAKEHHQKDADGKVIEHEDTTPSSVEEKTVLEQLAENGREIDAFEAVISYLIDEGFAKSWEEAQDIMVTLKPELVEEVYQNQLKKLSK